MGKKDHKRRKIKNTLLKPESLMMSYGYNPEWSEGAIKSPIFQTSTFVFKSAADGKAFFQLAYGLREKEEGEQLGLIYSRLNNPDLEILENRLCLWDNADDCAVFQSGMAAISTTLLTFLQPGDVILHSEPIYGGTEHFIKNILPKFNITSVGFLHNDTPDSIRQKLKRHDNAANVKMIFIETPANPTNAMFDIKMCAALAKELSSKDREVVMAVDNTFLGPLWQHPLQLGADLVLYSATKFIGGHSDVIAGACLGSAEYMKQIKAMRTFMGNMAGPWTGWLLLRSLETLKIRMTRQMKNARKIAAYLESHPKVMNVYYPGLLTKSDAQFAVFKDQCESPGAMVAFDIEGGEKEAFRFLDSLTLFHLAVSLGSNESLAEHPATMTHADVDKKMLKAYGIGDNMIRLSIGIENYRDLILDLEQALEQTAG